MASLFDTIQQNRQQLGATQAPMTDQTSTVQNLLRAKSGKAPSASDVGTTSNVGEQAAVADTQSQLASLQPQLQTQQQATNTALAGQKQQESQQTQAIAQTNRFNTVQNNIKTQQILQGLSQDRGNLQTQQAQANLEQVAFTLSMQDKQYTDQLQQVGRQRRLDDANNFKSAMQDQAFGANIDLLKQKLGNNDILQASDRDFQKAMSNLSIDDAMKMANESILSDTELNSQEIEEARQRITDAAKASNEQRKWAAIGQIAGAAPQAGAAGYKGYQQYQSDNPSEPDHSDTGIVADNTPTEGSSVEAVV